MEGHPPKAEPSESSTFLKSSIEGSERNFSSFSWFHTRSFSCWCPFYPLFLRETARHVQRGWPQGLLLHLARSKAIEPIQAALEKAGALSPAQKVVCLPRKWVGTLG